MAESLKEWWSWTEPRLERKPDGTIVFPNYKVHRVSNDTGEVEVSVPECGDFVTIAGRSGDVREKKSVRFSMAEVAVNRMARRFGVDCVPFRFDTKTIKRQIYAETGVSIYFWSCGADIQAPNRIGIVGDGGLKRDLARYKERPTYDEIKALVLNDKRNQNDRH